MIRSNTFYALATLALLAVAAHPGFSAGSDQALVPFVANRGQVRDPAVRFVARPLGGAACVRADGSLLYALPLPAETGNTAAAGVAVIEERLLNARDVSPAGHTPSAARISQFLGSDPAAWQTDLPAWDRIAIGEPYPGITLTLAARGHNVEKLFTVAPGADPAAIRVAIAGADALAVTPDGELAAHTELGDLRFTRPVAYQEGDDGRRELVPAAYDVAGLSYGFTVGPYDPTRPLLIDPLLASTYLGGMRWDQGQAIAVDGQGRVYVAGFTSSDDFPTTPGAYTSAMPEPTPNTCAFVSRFNPGLTELQASTFLGGSNVDSAAALLLDSHGYVYVVGDTWSTNFPTTDFAYSRTLHGDQDVFVARLSPDLDRLSAATYLGGDRNEIAACLARNSSGSILVGGRTWSTNFPTTAGVFQPAKAMPDDTYTDGFIAMFTPDLAGLLASTFFGGSNFDEVSSLAVDSFDNVIAAGATGGNGFPATVNAFQKEFQGGEIDGFVAKLNSGLTQLAAATYLGGRTNDWIFALALDNPNTVYAAGYTASDNFPSTLGSFQSTPPQNGDTDGFLVRLDASLHALEAGAFLGGTNFDFATCLARAADGVLIVGGYTHSDDFPATANAFRRTRAGNSDAFLARVSSGLGELLAATYFGGTWDDYTHSLALNDQGDVFFTGYTESAYQFPITPAAYGPYYHQGPILWYGDAYVARLDSRLSRQATPRNDYDGDGISDLAVFDNTRGYWYAENYWTTTLLWADAWGWSGAWPVPGDFDGDRVGDLAVFDSNTGNWYIKSATNTPIAWAAAWGWPGAWPVAGDYDADGVSDLAVFDQNSGYWYIRSLVRPDPVLVWALPWGWPGAWPVPGDFDGDRASDLAVFDQNSGYWYIRSAGDSVITWAQPWGWPGAWPVPGNYDRYTGDDLAVYDTNAGLWYILSSHTGTPAWAFPWGWPGALPVPGDFNGDSVSDLALFDTVTGAWYVWSLADNPGHVILWARTFGWPGAFPVGSR
jgi:hypothetical protein